MKKKNLRLQPIKRRVSLAWKPNWLPYRFEALFHNLDARSSARPTVSQNSDFEEDFLSAENVDVFDAAESVISLKNETADLPYEDLFKDCEDCGPKSP